MSYVYEAVERIPAVLRPNVVYHSDEFELAALLCACGCGHRITLLVPDSHRVKSEGGLATIRPSIGVCDAACKSHYVITAGEVEWLPAFTTIQAQSLMQRQIARHVEIDNARLSWSDRFWRSVHRAYAWVRSKLSIRKA
jgi:hypothetical protein